MEDIKDIDISKYCFSVCLDTEEADFNKIFGDLSEIGDVAFFENKIYIWLNQEKTESDLVKVFKDSETKNYFYFPVSLDEVRGKNNFLENFVGDHYYKAIESYLSEKYQKEIKSILLKLENAKKLN